MKTAVARAAALFVAILMLPGFTGHIRAQSGKAYLQLTDEQKETLDDVLSTSKDMVTESQEKLTEMLGEWQKLKDNFHRLPEPVQKAINDAEAAGLTAKVNYTLGKLKQFEGELKDVISVKEDIEKAINFYQRYAPDDQNPFRSLEVMSNLFEDVEKLLPDEQEYEAFKAPVTFMIRTGIRYFKEGIDLALGGLRNIQKQIRDRAGNCMGYVGGDGTADSSDPRRKAFTDLGTSDVICYTGVRPVGGEIWSDETGNSVYIWSSGKWTRMQAGFGLITEIFRNWRLANGSVLTADEMIRWCNSYQRLYIESRDWGAREFGRLSSMDLCREKLLEKRNSYGDWMSLMESVNTDPNLFIAKYIFDKDGIRAETKRLTTIMYDQQLFEGVIEDQEGNRVSGASVTVTTPAGARTDQTVNGRYTIMMDYPEAGRNSAPIEITVTSAGYNDLRETSVIYSQCQDLGLLRLDGEQADEEPDDISCGPNEYYDPVAEVCICNDGYVRNAQGICVPEDDVRPVAPDCPDPNSEPVFNNVTGVYDCVCKDYFIPDPVSGQCKPDVQQILNDSDCSQWPNTQPVWDYVRNEVYCDCLPGYSWRPDNLGCEETGKLLASQADCSGYPNTQGVWDDVNKKVYCDCLPGYVWDKDGIMCIPAAVAQLSGFSCDNLPYTMPMWDPVRQEPYCDCLPGYKWRDDNSGCEQITATQIVQAQCSHIPNSQPVYDAINDIMVCDCMPGFVWNSSRTACEPERRRPAIDMNTLVDFMTIISDAITGNVPGGLTSGNTPVPASQQPAVVHQSRCNDTQKAGGDAPEVHRIDLGMTSGVFKFDYQTYDVKDQIIISQGGRTIFNSGCVGESRSVQVQFSGYTSVIEVRVNPNCSGSSGTAWNFTVHCPGY